MLIIIRIKQNNFVASASFMSNFSQNSNIIFLHILNQVLKNTTQIIYFKICNHTQINGLKKWCCIWWQKNYFDVVRYYVMNEWDGVLSKVGSALFAILFSRLNLVMDFRNSPFSHSLNIFDFIHPFLFDLQKRLSFDLSHR